MRLVTKAELESTRPNSQSTLIVAVTVMTVQMTAVDDPRLLVIEVVVVIRRNKVAAVDDHSSMIVGVPVGMSVRMAGTAAVTGMCGNHRTGTEDGDAEQEHCD